MLITNLLIFVAVIGVLIFVHELGHFLAAKACGVYVDRFSIGLLRVGGFKWGETDYCVGILPFGGYVRMAGQEDAPLTDEERETEYGHVPPERWFNRKPVWQRYIVIIAGPAMNLVMGLALYTAVAAMGQDADEYEHSARIGMVLEKSAAAAAPLYVEREGAPLESYTGEPDATGWKTGDTVVSVNGEPVNNFRHVQIQAVLSGAAKPHHVVIDRPNAEGGVTRFVSPIQPEAGDDGLPKYGIAPFSTALIKEIMPGMPAETAGLQPGDIIARVNGDAVDKEAFSKLAESTPEGTVLTLTVDRGGQMMDISLQPQTWGRFKGLSLGSQDGRDPAEANAVVLGVTEEFAKETGIQRKDVITRLNGEPITRKALEDWARANPGAAATVTVERPRILFGLLQSASTLELELPVGDVRAVGVMWGIKTIPMSLPPSQWVSAGMHEAYEAFALTLLTLKGLVMRDVSPKGLGGPVMIATLTSQAAEDGLARLLKITAFISINLCILNLLPLPVLDGGLLVINGIEAIRRKPLSPRFLERFQMAGLAFIVSLMLFVTWNDIGRLLEGLKP